MRISIPGFKGLYFDTDAESPAVSIALTVAGRRAPKPQGYAVQLLPYLWSFDVDLRELPNDHPIQYLHPEGAQSLGELSGDRTIRQAGTELETVLRFVWAVNQEVETASNRLVGREPERDGVTIEITEGSITADGEELETDAFDVDETPSESSVGSDAGVGSRSVTEIDVDEGVSETAAESDELDDHEIDGEDEDDETRAELDEEDDANEFERTDEESESDETPDDDPMGSA
ncbi:hypothetical protein [Halosolutus gelatinilyticus]|uniref:hypothetical protein n=1 Tax=Halosolutus gelatinilyticus TaxID=2931975 RepID=UPI001FF1A8F1|nr:hypothetical protein [Halosolutus gelatinilyticus]